MKPFTSKHCAQYLTKSSPFRQENPRLNTSVSDKLESRADKQLVASNFGVSDRPSFRNPKEMSATPSFNDGYDSKLSRKVGIDVVQGGIKSNVAQLEFSKYGGKESEKSNRQLQNPTTFGYSDGPKDYNLSIQNKSKVRHLGSGAPAPEFMNLPTSDEVASSTRRIKR
jgi:hypothetical protein